MVRALLALVPVLIAPLVVSGGAEAYSMVAVIETEARGALRCGAPGQESWGGQPLLGVSDELVLPALDLPGGETGPALQVKPLVIIKELDRCSPPLFTALVNRERVSRVEVRLFDRQGVHFFTIRLENALVTRISRTVRSHGLHEEVAFAYQIIHLIDERTGVSASHDFGG